MKKYTVVCDLHLLSSYALDVNLDDILKLENVIFCGDEIDMANMRKSSLNKAIELAKKISASGRPYLSSNHTGLIDGIDFPLAYGEQENSIIFTHGHFTHDRADHYLAKAYTHHKGCSLLKFIIKGIYNKLPRLVPISKEYAERSAEFARANGYKTIVMGHAHPIKIYDEMVNGVRVIFCPRGITEIEL